MLFKYSSNKLLLRVMIRSILVSLQSYVQKIQMCEEKSTTYKLFKQELKEEVLREIKESLSDNKQETIHLRQDFDEMKSYIVLKYSNGHISKVFIYII